jgi:type IV fimbrial biogenesis protein FimT
MSMVELMVVMGIMAIMAAFAAPSFVDSMRSNTLTSQTNNVLTGVKLARAEAIRRNRRVVFCRSDNAATSTPSCATGSGAWAGWLIFADANNNLTYNASEDVIRAETLDSNKIKVLANTSVASNTITFTGDGMPRDTSGNMLTNGALRVCVTSSANNNARDISLTAGGKTVLTQATSSTCAAPA